MKYNYIDHYQYKSLEEFVKKINLKGDGIYISNIKLKYEKVIRYLINNRLTQYKIDYICKNCGLNYSYIMEKLNIALKK